MRKLKKTLSAVLTVIMIFSSLSVAFAIESSYTVKADERIVVAISEEDEIYVKFVPEKTAVFEFKSDASGDDDPYAYLYDEAENEIICGDDDIDYNFCFEASLEAGKTYYLLIGAYNTDDITMGLTVTTGHIHENLTEIPAVPATCAQAGNTAGLKCTDCGLWILEPEVIIAQHTDENADHICDICSQPAILASEKTSEGVEAVLYNCGDLVVSGAGSFSIFITDAIYDNSETIKKVFLGKDINYTTLHAFPTSFEGFIVDEENANYKSDAANALYSKDGTELLLFPTGSPIEEYTVPDGVTVISVSAFSDNKTLKKVNLPDSLRAIDSMAFSDCAALEGISLPSALEEIGSFAFSGCDKIKSVTIPLSVVDLRSNAFDYSEFENIETIDGCSYMGDILVEYDVSELPENNINIREGTRLICVPDYLNVAAVVIPASLKVTPQTFANLDNARFIVNENNPYYCADEDGVLFSKDKTVLMKYPNLREGIDYTVPQGVKEIGNNSFEYSDITSVTLPEGLEKIGDEAFNYCDLSQLAFPESLKEIGDNAFYSGDDTLKSVVVPKNVERLGKYTFDCEYLAILNPDCVIEKVYNYTFIIGYDGSTAEKYASENKLAFATLGNSDGTNHNHMYIPTVITVASCRNEGLTFYSCPCGNTQTYTVTTEKQEHRWDYEGDYMECIRCGETQSIIDYYDCDCECHEERNKVQEFFFKIKLFLWKLFRTKEFCYCGTQHW